jgi:hypothetical protein
MNVFELIFFLLPFFVSFFLAKYLYGYIGWWSIPAAIFLAFGGSALLIVLARKGGRPTPKK